MTSNSILLSGIPDFERREVLFQSAVYWAEQGNKVLYITQSKIESLPTTGHGPQIPPAEVLAKIHIMYAENEEKLLEFVTEIVTLRDIIPKVILVESLDKVAASEHSLARASATLRQVATCCSACCNLPVHLLVTVATPADKLPPAVCSMFNSLWCFDSKFSTLIRKLPIDSSNNAALTLATRADGAFVLRQVDQLFSSSGR